MNEDFRVHVVECSDRKYLYMRYIDPITGKPVRRSAKTANRREAEKLAAKWEDDLQKGRYSPSSKILWEDFREQYEEEKLSTLAENTQQSGASAMNHLERVINPKRLANLTSATLSRFQAKLRKEGMKDTSLDAHLGHLRSALSWAVLMGFLPKLPEMHRPKRVKGRKLMRGRPITTEEFERMLEAVPKVRRSDPEPWQRYLTGLWLSGLRLEESLVVSWDDDAPFMVDLTGRHPRFRIYAEAEKGHEDRLLPMTPDFAEFVLQTPPEAREGRVFDLMGIFTGKPISPKRVCRIVSDIGRKAGVVVNKADGKFASAHDLRRSFGTRWAPQVKPITLQLLMRHQSIETTLKYYVDADADDVADELWKVHGQRGSSLGSSGQSGGRKEKEGPAGESTEPQSMERT